MSDVYYTCQCLVCSLNDSILVKSTDKFFCNMYDEYIKKCNFTSGQRICKKVLNSINYQSKIGAFMEERLHI